MVGMGRDRKRGDLLTVPGLFDVSPPCFEGTWSTFQDQVAGMPASRSAYGDADSGMLSPVQGHTADSPGAGLWHTPTCALTRPSSVPSIHLSVCLVPFQSSAGMQQ